jgi:Protein of unknown function (DUF1499)
MLANRHLQTEIGGRPNIRPSEREQQIDFSAPSPDSPNRQQLGQGSLILGGAKPSEIDPAAETAGAEGHVLESKKGFRRQRAANPDQPPVHCRGGINRHLLLEDDVQQRAEPVATPAKSRRPGFLEYLCKMRLDCEDRDPFGEAFGRINRGVGPLSRTAHRTGHLRSRWLVHVHPLNKGSYGIVSLEPPAGLHSAWGERVRLGRPIKMALLAIGLAILLPGLALRIYMGSGAEDRLAPDEDVRIPELRSPLPKNSFLACPAGYCSPTEAISSPVFEIPWDRLRDYWTEMISGETRIVRAGADFGPQRYVYIQHSPVFRFPDIVTVELVPLGPNRSSIALYSRSRYGEHDFAKNRKRVERWLLLLQKVARPPTPSEVRAP